MLQIILRFQASGFDAFNEALKNNPVETECAVVAGLIAIVAFGPEIAVGSAAVAALAGPLTAILGETLAPIVASELLSLFVQQSGQSLYGALQQTIEHVVGELGGTVTSVPSATITPNQISSGSNLILFPSGGVLPQILNFSALSSSETFSSNGTTVLSLNQGTWSSLSSNGQQYTISSIPQTDGNLASTTNTFDLSGNLTKVAQIFTNGNIITFDTPTYSSLSFNPVTNLLNVTLTTPQGAALGNLAYNSTNGTGVVSLADGLTLNVSGGQNIYIHDPVEAPLSILDGFLNDLGDPITASQLDQLNFNYLNPAVTPYDVTGTVQKVDDSHANVYYAASGDGAIVAGQPTAVITDYETEYDENGNPYTVAYNVDAAATNYLSASGDISRDSISGIQELDTSGNLTLTASQFSQFAIIKGATSFTAATGGTFNLNDVNVDGGTVYSMSATDWSGTTLVGNDQNGQRLSASLLGNDTLQAGNGSGDTLYAGEGADTLIGGTGGDTFYAYNGGLAAGSAVQGNGGGNSLLASGDISGATITGVQTLDLNGTVTLTAAQLAGFSSIRNGGAIDAATGGTYDISAKSTADINLTALTNQGTTLIGNDANSERLTPSALGNDTLIAGNGSNDILDASSSFGNNTLKAGDGSGDVLRAGGGNDTLTAGNGNNDRLDASGTVARRPLIAGNGAGDSLYAGSGTDTLTAGNGAADNLYAGSGVDTLTGGTGGDTFNFNFYTQPASSLTDIITGHGTGNTLNVVDGDYNLTGMTISGIQSLRTEIVELTADQFSGFSEIYSGFGTGGGITAETGGTYDLEGKSTEPYTLVAASNDGTTLIGDDANGEYLQASPLGSDTLISGNGANDTLDARNTSGTDTLQAGDGNSDRLTAGKGNNTLIAGNGANDILDASESSGTDTLQAGNGAGDTLIAGTGFDTMIGGTGGDTFDFEFSPTAGTSDIVQGQGSGNILIVNENISGMIISGIQTLQTTYVALTASQFAGFTTILSDNGLGGVISAATGGTFNLEGKSTEKYELACLSNTATTLIGNDSDGEYLEASGTSGNDTLQAGNGTGDVLQAGTGVNTLIGGTGGDTFYASVLASGSVIEGNGTGNTLFASGDISGATITGVQTLETTAGIVTLNAQELSGFSFIQNTSIIDAAGGGVFDLSAKSTADISLTAVSNAGTTLIGNDSNQEVLTASASGNDTLRAGNGNGDNINGGGGQDTLIAGAGQSDILQAGHGNTTLIAGSGGDYLIGGSGNDIFDLSGAGGHTIIQGGTGTNTAVVAYSYGSGYTLSGTASDFTMTGAAGVDTLKNVQYVQFAGGRTIATAMLFTTVAPTLSITSAALQSNQTTVTLTGMIDPADAGLTISIDDGSTVLGTATPNASGAWSSTVTVSAHGVHTLTAQAMNAAGTGVSNTVVDLVGASTS